MLTEFVTAQDALAWEAQGVITDRTEERLGAFDRGFSVIRDPAKNVRIDLDLVHEPFGLYREKAPA